MNISDDTYLYLTKVLGLYLKERNWKRGVFDDRDTTCLQQTLNEMVLDSIIEKKYSALDLVGYGSIVYDLAIADEQYRKVLMFIDESPEIFKQQLTQFVYPSFIHFYLELVMNGKNEDAQTFWCRFVYTFWILEGFQDLMLDLKQLSSSKEVMSHKYFSMFRTKKYVIRLSQDCSEYFIRFLDAFSNDWSPFFSSSCNARASEPEVKIESSPPQSPDLVSGRLKDIIKKVYELPPSPPSIYLYSVVNANNMCCADLSYDKRILAGGFNDSGVRLWQFLPPWSMPDTSDKAKLKNDQAETKSIVLHGHNSTVYDIAFNPLDNLLFSCSGDRTVRAWTMDTFEIAGLYVGHHGPIWSVTASPKGNYFATGSKDLKACLWTVERKFPLSVYVGHELDVNCVKFHPNCNYIVTGSRDKTIRLWSTERKDMVRMFVGHKGNVFAVAFSPDGNVLATAGEDLIINIWDLASSKIIRTFDCDIDRIHCLSFSFDGKILAAAGMKNTIRLYNVYSVKEENSNDDSSSGTSSSDQSDEFSEFHSFNSNFHLLRFCPKNLLLAIGTSNGLM